MSAPLKPSRAVEKPKHARMSGISNSCGAIVATIASDVERGNVTESFRLSVKEVVSEEVLKGICSEDGRMKATQEKV